MHEEEGREDAVKGGEKVIYRGEREKGKMMLMWDGRMKVRRKEGRKEGRCSLWCKEGEVEVEEEKRNSMV